MRYLFRCLAAAAVAAQLMAAGAAAAAAQPRYRVQDLSSLVGLDDFYVLDFNNRGDFTLADLAQQRGYLWRDGRLHDLGPWRTGTLALNDRGDVAGTRLLDDGRRSPFLWRDGRFTALAPALGARSATVWDINAAGQVAGEADGRAFVLDGARARYLELPGTTASAAQAINDRGEVGGALSLPNDKLDQRGFIWRHGWTQTLQEPIVYEWTGDYEVTALNNRGNAVVHWSDDNWGEFGSALYLDGVMWDLGYGTYARDINNHDLAAGHSVVEVNWDEYEYTALLFRDGQAVNLNRVLTPQAQAHWEWLETVQALNDRGEIIGHGRLADGTQRVFWATPVPEPSALWMLLAGGAGLRLLRGQAWRGACRGGLVGARRRA